jgi:hypothetical protein
VWAGVDSAREHEKLEARKLLEIDARPTGNLPVSAHALFAAVLFGLPDDSI